MSFTPLHVVAASVARRVKKLRLQSGARGFEENYADFSRHFAGRLKAGKEFLPVDELPSFYERVERILPGEEQADNAHGFTANPMHVSLRQFVLGTALLHSAVSFFPEEEKRLAIVRVASVFTRQISPQHLPQAIAILQAAGVSKTELQDFCRRVKDFNSRARAHFTSLSESARSKGKERKAVFYSNAGNHLSYGITNFYTPLTSLARKMH